MLVQGKNSIYKVPYYIQFQASTWVSEHIPCGLERTAIEHLIVNPPNRQKYSLTVSSIGTNVRGVSSPHCQRSITWHNYFKWQFCNHGNVPTPQFSNFIARFMSQTNSRIRVHWGICRGKLTCSTSLLDAFKCSRQGSR